MKRFIQNKFDNYYIRDNKSGEEKLIGREKDFIEYINFYRDYSKNRSVGGLKELINIWKCLEYFEENMGSDRVGVGLEIIIRYEI